MDARRLARFDELLLMYHDNWAEEEELVELIRYVLEDMSRLREEVQNGRGRNDLEEILLIANQLEREYPELYVRTQNEFEEAAYQERRAREGPREEKEDLVGDHARAQREQEEAFAEEAAEFERAREEEAEEELRLRRERENADDFVEDRLGEDPEPEHKDPEEAEEMKGISPANRDWLEELSRANLRITELERKEANGDRVRGDEWIEAINQRDQLERELRQRGLVEEKKETVTTYLLEDDDIKEEIFNGISKEFDLKKLTKLLKQHNALIAGSYLVMHSLGVDDEPEWANADVDIWIHQGSKVDKFLARLTLDLGLGFPSRIGMREKEGYERLYKHIFRMYKTTTRTDRRVQIIVTRLPPPVVVGQFDLTVCRVGLEGDGKIRTYNWTPDRYQWIGNLIEMSLNTDTNVKQSTFEWVRTLHRVAKYYARGFWDIESRNFKREITKTLQGHGSEGETVVKKWNKAISALQLPLKEIREFILVYGPNATPMFVYDVNDDAVEERILSKMRKRALESCKKGLGYVTHSKDWIRYFRPIQILKEEDQLEVMSEYNKKAKGRELPLFYDLGKTYAFTVLGEHPLFVMYKAENGVEHDSHPPVLVSSDLLLPLELRGESSYQAPDVEESDVVYEQCFDFVAYDEIKDFMPHLRESNGVGLIMGRKVYCLGVEQFQKVFAEQAGEFARDQDVMVECIIDPEDARRKKVLMKDRYVQVRLEAIFLVPLVDVLQLLQLYKEEVTRLFEIKPTGKKLEFTASLGAATHLSRELERQTEYRRVEGSWVSADHCQTGSEKMLYRLVPTRNRQ